MEIKYKIKEVADDFAMPAKDVIEAVGKFFPKPKSSSQTLSEEQLNVVGDYITRSLLWKRFSPPRSPRRRPRSQRPHRSPRARSRLRRRSRSRRALRRRSPPLRPSVPRRTRPPRSRSRRHSRVRSPLPSPPPSRSPSRSRSASVSAA